MAEDNVAVLDRDTVEEPAEATPDELVEAADAVAAETDTVDEEAEAEQPGGLDLDALTDEELADLPKVKSLLARREQAAKDRQAAEDRRRVLAQQSAQFEEQLHGASRVAVEQAVNELATMNDQWAKLYQKGDVETPSPPPAELQKRFARAFDTGRIATTEAMHKRAMALFKDPEWFGGVRLEPEVVEAMSAARVNPVAYLEAVATAAAQAAQLKMAEDLQREYERQQQAQKTAAAEVAKAKGNAQARAAAPAPTRTSGTVANRANDLAAIIEDPTRPAAERKAAFKKLYGYDP